MWPPSRRGKNAAEFGIIFDFDGTLARMSIDFDEMRRAINALFVRYHVPLHTLKRRFLLERIDEVYGRLTQGAPDIAQSIKDEALSIITSMELRAAAQSNLLPGVYPRLWALKGQGIRLGIATRNCQAAFNRVIGKARVFFDTILTRENSPAFKPDKAALQPILKSFSLPPDHILMIGDHPMDILTARNVSILPVGVLTGTGSRKALTKAGAHRVFKHVNQAIDALLRALY